MDENNSQIVENNQSEEIVEKEINLSPIEEEKKEPNFISKKNVNDLTEEEKTTIISNYQNGINQPFYDVKQFKNGKFRILKKKEIQPTVAQKVVNENSEKLSKKEQKVYYSDNQLLFEHIIELNAKIDKLMNKHKKLKKKYQNLQSEIYVDDNESEEYCVNNFDEKKLIQQQQNLRQQQNFQQKGWRSKITFI